MVSFLPRLYAEGFTPLKSWGGGERSEDGVITIPWPEYDEVVKDFFRTAAGECWTDPGYLRKGAVRMLERADLIRSADLGRIKTMLTYCVRGERFCSGHWNAMILGGHIRRLLERLAELKPEIA